MSVLLAADIGGTFSRFALFRLEKTAEGLCLSLAPGSALTLPTQEAADFADLCRHLPAWFRSCGLQPDHAALAVPGPVENGLCLAPNINWPLRREDPEAILQIPAALLNDFAAQGMACLFPAALAPRPVLPGQARPGYNTALLGPGTGLGKAVILPAETSIESSRAGSAGIFFSADQVRRNLPRRVLPSEGGHALFPFQGNAEADFEAFARDISGRRDIIGDMTVTGYGLSLIHAFHNKRRDLLPPEAVSPLIPSQPLVLEWFARFLGRACRNFALETLSLGGVYLSGGIIARLPGLLEHPALAEEFRRSEGQRHLLENLPLSWISNPDVGLWGSAIYGVMTFEAAA